MGLSCTKGSHQCALEVDLVFWEALPGPCASSELSGFPELLEFIVLS